MRFSKVALACAVAALATGIFSGSALALPATQTLLLDSHESPSVGFAGPVSTSSTAASSWYVITVSGTYSLWKPSFWNAPTGSTCRGTAVNSPAFPTTGVTNSKTGVDAEMIFAAARGAGACRATGSKHFDVFEQSTFGTWRHNETTSGAPTSPASDHTYYYALRSSSTGAAIQFRIRDYHTGDNYGQLQIQVRKAVQSDCSFTNPHWDYSNFGYNNTNQCTRALPAS
jgi:hypothetical protein